MSVPLTVFKSTNVVSAEEKGKGELMGTAEQKSSPSGFDDQRRDENESCDSLQKLVKGNIKEETTPRKRQDRHNWQPTAALPLPQHCLFLIWLGWTVMKSSLFGNLLLDFGHTLWLQWKYYNPEDHSIQHNVCEQLRRRKRNYDVLDSEGFSNI